MWDTEIVKSEQTSCVYDGSSLPLGAIVNWELQLFDKDENQSKIGRSYFKTACFDTLLGNWIKSPCEKDFEVQYFTRDFSITQNPERAVLYHCGIGLSKVYINGNETDNYRLQPLHINYSKECFYVTTPLDTDKFDIGKNKLQITVAGGWRTNYGHYLDNMSAIRQIEFMGKKCLWAMLVLYYENGEKELIATDTDWNVTTGNIVSSHLFDGERYDENAIILPEKNAILSDFKPLKLSPQYLEPVCVKREIKPQDSYIVNGKTIYDFGENLAGVVRLKAKGTCKNLKFILRHSEEVSEEGELFCDTLRSVNSRYISGEMMSTAMYYMTLCIVSGFAGILEKNDDYQEEMNRIKTAFLNKWFNQETAFVGTGTQGEQALALYTKLIPKEYESKVAKVMADAVINDGNRLKTGNITTLIF